MATTKSNSKGQFKFEGLAEGRYEITPSGFDFGSDSFTFIPQNRVIDVTSDIVDVNFRMSMPWAPPLHLTPTEPKKISGSAPHTISGKVHMANYGLKGVELELEYLGALAGDDPFEDYIPAAPPKIRIIPPGLLEHKQQRLQHTCWCWAIKPRRGNWEGYCSFIRNLNLPSYSSEPGEDDEVTVIPAMTYKSAHGMTASAIPTRLQLGKDGVQATVLAFDRDKLTRGYYTGAEFEVFEINYRGDLSERIVWHAGLLGSIQVGDLEASIELTSWSDLAARTLGRSYGPTCDVGRLIELANEEFGAGRCRNQVLNDGPLKADWTVLATVKSLVPGRERAEFEVTYGSTAMSGSSLNSAFDARLAEGKIEFLSSSIGGVNAGAIKDVKSGDGDGDGMMLILHAPLAYAPAIGDKLYLTSGCQKTPEACKAYNNFMNFRGFNPPGRKNALRNFED